MRFLPIGSWGALRGPQEHEGSVEDGHLRTRQHKGSPQREQVLIDSRQHGWHFLGITILH